MAEGYVWFNKAQGIAKVVEFREMDPRSMRLR